MNIVKYKQNIDIAKKIIEKEIEKSDNVGWKGHLLTKFFEFKTIAKFFCGDNVLELGSAEHHLTTKIFSQWSSRLTVVDIKDTFENEKFENTEIIIKDWFDFETEEKFSDIVFIHGLEHIDKGVKLLSKLKNFLDENGRIHIIVPNALSLHRIIGSEMGFLESPHSFTEMDKISDHKKVYDVFTLKKDLKLAGLYAFHMEGIQLKPMTDGVIYKHFPREYVKALHSLNYLFNEYCSELYILALKEEL